MQKLTDTQTFQLLAKSLGKCCMQISFSEGEALSKHHTWYHELIKAAPYLNYDEDHQLLIEGCGTLVFDSEEEMNETFELTVGDDGPTKTNPYNGPARVYALTCSPDGQLLTENT